MKMNHDLKNSKSQGATLHRTCVILLITLGLLQLPSQLLSESTEEAISSPESSEGRYSRSDGKVSQISAEKQIRGMTQTDTIVQGRVTDEAGNPIPGVNVMAEGTKIGAITDMNGNYSIAVPNTTRTLVFSFIGMKTAKVLIDDRKNIDLVMSEEAIGLDEVVVIGYGEQRKINLTGSVSSIQSDDLIKVPSANISELLIGKASGLYTRQSQGVPGDDDATLSIRGFGNPLILVDGIETSWSRLDPNEIESISVLKDAAAAIYGARAGNGVLLITTKRGSMKKPTVTFRSNYTFQQPTVIPEFVSSWKYAELLREGEFNDNLPYTYSEEDIEKFKKGDDPDYTSTNWYDEIFVKWAPMHSQNLSLDGGNERVKYFLSLGYLDQASIFKSGDLSFNRYNARSNIDVRISDRLSLAFDISYRNEEQDMPESSFQSDEPLITIWTDLKLAQPVWPAHLPDDSKGGAYAGFNTRSPLAQTYSDKTGFIQKRRQFITGRTQLTYEIPGIEGLEARAALNYTTYNYYNKVLDKPFEVFSYDYESEEYVSWGQNGSSSLGENVEKYTQLFPTISLNYNRSFGDHSVKGLLLGEWISSDYLYLSAGRIDLLSNDLPYLFAGSADNITNNGWAEETGRISYAGRANYNYKGKYLFETTVRFDASHKFPPETRWGFFPSFSGGWRISEEPFIKNNISWIDNLKLRASYSQSGDDNVAAFQYLTGYTISSSNLYIFGNENYTRVISTGMPNEEITWLSMTTYDLGLDGRFLRGLIGFEFDLFYRLTEDIFGEPLESYPSTFGAGLPTMNINSNDDRGFELTLNHRNKIGNELNYLITGSVSYAREKYVKYSESPYEDPDEIRIYQNTGHYTNRWIGYRSDGLFMSQEEIDNHPVDQDQAGNSTLRPGDIKYIDINDDGVIDWRDQDVIGYGTFPDLNFNFSFWLGYKGLSVTALFQGASMVSHYIDADYWQPLNNMSTPYEFNYKYRWQPDPDNPDVNINPDAQLPAIRGDGTGTSPNNTYTSDFWLKDGTYLRLKNLNISYTLPAKWTQKVKFEDISFYVAGSNLLTFSKLGIFKKSKDPEGFGLKYYPPMKTISFGINVSL